MSTLSVEKMLAQAEHLFRNHYKCKCGEAWDEIWDSMCDSECKCGRTISPSSSDTLVPDKGTPKVPTVEITVHGGLISAVRSDTPVDIRVVDYDNDGADSERIEQDTVGWDCVVSEYQASVDPFMIKRGGGI